jgi:hypothetical protein
MISAHFHKGRIRTSPSIRRNNRLAHCSHIGGGSHARLAAAIIVAALAGLGSLLAGCANPNAIGVQDMGSITGRVINAKTQAAVSGALLSVGNVVVQSDPQGAFNFGPPNGTPQSAVPIGQQTINVYANGYNPAQVTVSIPKKNTTVDAGLVRLTPVGP